MNKRIFKLGHFIPAVIFTLLSILVCVEDIRFSYDILLKDQTEFLILTGAVFLWAGVSVFTPYISKWHVVILLVLINFRSINGWPLNVFVSNNGAVIFSDLLLVLASMSYIAYALGYLGNNERSARFATKHFWISILNIHLIPVFFTILSFFALSQTVSNFTGGHVKLTAKGMKMQNLVMENSEGKRAHLIGMIHMGGSEYYKQVQAGWKKDSSRKKLVLHEGVSDKKGLMKAAIDYSFLAAALGLDTQSEQWSKPQKKALPATLGGGQIGADHLNADIDLSELPEEGLALLNKIFSVMAAPDMETLIKNMGDVKISDSEMAEFMDESLIKFRNDRLMNVLNDNLDSYDEVYIPWGAAHLKEIESQLVAQGFQEVSKSYYTAFLWSDIWTGIREGLRGQ